MPADELRLFLALWPPAAEAAALQAHARLWQWPAAARLTPPHSLHLTLHFLGAVPAGRTDELIDGLAVPCEQELPVSLDTPEVWPGGVAVLAGATPHESLLRLHARLAEALRSLGLPVEQRPFRLHLTLARRAAGARPPEGAPPVAWVHREAYRLVQSLPQGGGYRALAHYGAGRERRRVRAPPPPAVRGRTPGPG